METKRKGSRSTKDIPKEILKQLNNGEIESANLVEWLAIDQQLLLENILKGLNKEEYLASIKEGIKQLKKQTVNTISEAIGVGILNEALLNKDKEILEKFATHHSDMVRCWATYTIGKNTNLSLKQIITYIQPFAADKHFGVREICWIAVRLRLANELEESISILTKWTVNKDENIRRFASEVLRPRGVWCEHIDELKTNPKVGLPILEPMKSDATKYVQDSVANWLNDASKTQPKFVTDICNKWAKESKTKETAYIIKRAMRTIEK